MSKVITRRIETPDSAALDIPFGVTTGPVRATKLSVGDNTDYELNVKNAGTSGSNAIAHLLAGNAGVSALFFSDTDANARGRVQYDHSIDRLELFAGNARRFHQTDSLTTIDNPTVVNAEVKIGPDAAGYGTSEPLAVVKDAAAAVNAVVRNNSASASASAGIAVNAYGNSWRMAVGSAAKNGNKLSWEVDALGSPVEMMGLTTGGNFSAAGTGTFGGSVTAQLPNPSNHVFRGFKYGVTGDSSDYGGSEMNMNTGEVRHSAGRATWGGSHTWYTNGAKKMELGSTGVLTLDSVGVAGGADVFALYQTGYGSTAAFYQCGAGSPNGASTALKLWNAASGRSISASGTINASGADYAEYRKNNGLVIAKGAVVGYRADGTLTLTWSEAILAGVKSTDPGLVGGDAWGTEDKIGRKPDEPKFAPPEYTGRAKPEDLPPEPLAPILTLARPDHPGVDASPVEAATYVLLKREYDAAADEYAKAVVAFDPAHAAWVELEQKYLRDMADWRTDQVEHETRTEVERNLFDTAVYPEFIRATAAFEERLEAARKEVDRIAYCGIVPCNVLGATPGYYIVACEGPNDTITGQCVQTPTEQQWRWVIGRCLRVLPDGRAEIQVLTS